MSKSILNPLRGYLSHVPNDLKAYPRYTSKENLRPVRGPMCEQNDFKFTRLGYFVSKYYKEAYRIARRLGGTQGYSHVRVRKAIGIPGEGWNWWIEVDGRPLKREDLIKCLEAFDE